MAKGLNSNITFDGVLLEVKRITGKSLSPNELFRVAVYIYIKALGLGYHLAQENLSKVTTVSHNYMQLFLENFPDEAIFKENYSNVAAILRQNEASEKLNDMYLSLLRKVKQRRSHYQPTFARKKGYSESTKTIGFQRIR